LAEKKCRFIQDNYDFSLQTLTVITFGEVEDELGRSRSVEQAEKQVSRG